jgi:hypothetical protein
VSQQNLPEVPDAPDPSQNDDWVGVTPDATPGDKIIGNVHDRETVETKHGAREVLSINIEDGKIERVPCFRTHLRELLALNDPRPGDGFVAVYFGPEPGQKKELYAMRVDKSARLDRAEFDVEPREAAKASRAALPFGDEEAAS